MNSEKLSLPERSSQGKAPAGSFLRLSIEAMLKVEGVDVKINQERTRITFALSGECVQSPPLALQTISNVFELERSDHSDGVQHSSSDPKLISLFSELIPE